MYPATWPMLAPAGDEGSGCAVQLLGGIGQGLLEPVARGLGLLGAGAVARRGRAQEPGGERGVGAEPGRVQRRSQHRPCNGSAAWAFSHRATSCGAAARVWVSP